MVVTENVRALRAAWRHSNSPAATYARRAELLPERGPTLHIERDRMAQTKDQQLKAVVIGMALGVLAQDVAAVTSRKMSLEFAFNHAWRNWRAARHFPSIKGHDPGNLFWIGLGKSERRSGACAAWKHGTWCTPYVTLDDWTVAEALDLHADSNVTAQDWIELGRLFVEYFKPEDVRRAQ